VADKVRECKMFYSSGNNWELEEKHSFLLQFTFKITFSQGKFFL
jgi:hypothetical protein